MSHSLFARKPTNLLLKEMGESRLRPVLGSLQLTSLGVGAIIGAGIFIVIGLVAKDKAGAASVAHGWSHYFADFLAIINIHLPHAYTDAPFDFNPASGKFVSTGAIIDLPALLISALLTGVLIIGIRESVTFNAIMVAV
jgi:amino acid transporter